MRENKKKKINVGMVEEGIKAMEGRYSEWIGRKVRSFIEGGAKI